MTRIASARWSRTGIFTTVCVLAIVRPGVQAREMGYSYMQISVNGKSAQNLVWNPAYDGWMKIEAVTARRKLAGLGPSDGASDKPTYGPWMDFPNILRDGESGPGQMEFGVGDEGGLDPLLDGQNRHVLIRQVESLHCDRQSVCREVRPARCSRPLAE